MLHKDITHELQDCGRDNPIARTGLCPLSPTHFADLFIRPRRFFTNHLAIGETAYALFVTWCFGIVITIERLDHILLQAEFGRPRPGWEHFGPMITQSWLGFWTWILIGGTIWGLFLWWVGG